MVDRFKKNQSVKSVESENLSMAMTLFRADNDEQQCNHLKTEKMLFSMTARTVLHDVR